MSLLFAFIEFFVNFHYLFDFIFVRDHHERIAQKFPTDFVQLCQGSRTDQGY